MAIRIVGVDIPQNKCGEVSLTYIYGIGRSSAKKILAEAGIDPSIKVENWTDDQHQTLDGYRLLPWCTSPYRSSRSWTEHQEQRPHAQGT